jgi:predicted nucleotide-binding protein with TIR-like domain
MKPSLFVGSSSESRFVAEAVQRNLSADVDVTLWTQVGFDLSKSTLSTLLREVRRYDYAAFVFAPDDVVRLRKQSLLATRDNVMFELGMFMSVLGPERCFFLVPRTEKPFRIPTDLTGLTAAEYEAGSDEGDLDARLRVACSAIAESIRRASRLSGEWQLYIAGSEHTDPNGMMIITCAGERAAARLCLRKNKEGKAVSRDFRYEGRYVAGQFALTFAQGDAEDQIVGSMVIRANSNRSEMVGQSVFWHHDRAKLVATDFALRRPENG